MTMCCAAHWMHNEWAMCTQNSEWSPPPWLSHVSLFHHIAHYFISESNRPASQTLTRFTISLVKRRGGWIPHHFILRALRTFHFTNEIVSDVHYVQSKSVRVERAKRWGEWNVWECESTESPHTLPPFHYFISDVVNEMSSPQRMK